MPGGFKAAAHITKQFLSQMDKPQTALDIGAGAGFYGEYLQAQYPACKSTAIECETDYVRDYKLKSIYQWVRNIDARCLLDEAAHYDLVIMGDVIEHLPKSTGTDLIHHFVYRCKYLLLAYPVMLQQDSWQGHRSEMHRSHWDKQDFTYFEHQLFIAKVRAETGFRPKHIIAIDGLDTHVIRWSQVAIRRKERKGI